jgi:hypothetical protein
MQRHGSRWPVPACALAPHAKGMLASDRVGRKLYCTIFILWGVESLYMTLLVTRGGKLAEAPGHWSGIEG